jgi:hypothetical protein
MTTALKDLRAADSRVMVALRRNVREGLKEEVVPTLLGGLQSPESAILFQTASLLRRYLELTSTPYYEVAVATIEAINKTNDRRALEATRFAILAARESLEQVIYPEDELSGLLKQTVETIGRLPQKEGVPT